jgi:hypothetical protein
VEYGRGYSREKSTSEYCFDGPAALLPDASPNIGQRTTSLPAVAEDMVNLGSSDGKPLSLRSDGEKQKEQISRDEMMMFSGNAGSARRKLEHLFLSSIKRHQDTSVI